MHHLNPQQEQFPQVQEWIATGHPTRSISLKAKIGKADPEEVELDERRAQGPQKETTVVFALVLADRHRTLTIVINEQGT
jgi:hypothetical protein